MIIDIACRYLFKTAMHVMYCMTGSIQSEILLFPLSCHFVSFYLKGFSGLGQFKCFLGFGPGDFPQGGIEKGALFILEGS